MWTLVLSFLLSMNSYAASPAADVTPSKPLPAQDSDWPQLLMRLDVRNLVGAGNSGAVPDTELATLVEKANHYWSQCSIRFVPRSIGNVNVLPLEIPYEPKSQADLSRIASALNPNGFHGAIPFTVAGPWNFVDNGFLLYGLGWAFANAQGNAPDRIGAMVGAQRIRESYAGQLAAHELGHALSLSHDPRADNVMAGGQVLSRGQCLQARGFAESVLSGFFEKLPARATL